MTAGPIHEASLEDHQNAFTEVAFLMDIFTSTIDNIMGGATAPVGRMAGREMAKKIPASQQKLSIDEALAALSDRMSGGFQFQWDSGAEGRELTFHRCALRDVCALRQNDPGGPLCKLFHSYMDGIVNELICKPVKSEMTHFGDQCRLTMRIQ